MDKIVFQSLPLIITITVLSISTYFLASIYSVNPLSLIAWAKSVILFPILFLLCFYFVGLVESIFAMFSFIDHDSGQLDIRSLWQATIFRINPLSGIVISSLMGLGIVSSANLAEIYRSITVIWYDSVLWMIEEPLFLTLNGSWLDVPPIWDKVYFSLWPFIFMVMAIIFRTCPVQQSVQVALSIVIAYYITRCFNLLYPTAGPVYYKKELFDLAGTVCGEVQNNLQLYMAGLVNQNGLMPGTMAMPSLHVGLMAIATWRLARIWIYTLWVTAPWFILVWLSTIMLGWHYLLDGIGGIVVIILATLISRFIVNLCEYLSVMRHLELENP